jgi:hypothetical protein
MLKYFEIFDDCQNVCIVMPLTKILEKIKDVNSM